MFQCQDQNDLEADLEMIIYSDCLQIGLTAFINYKFVVVGLLHFSGVDLSD